MVNRSATAYTALSNADEPQTFVLTTMATHSTKRRMTPTYMRRKLTGMVGGSTLRRLALAGIVALLMGGAPLAQTPEPAQDDSIETVRTRANAGDADAQVQLGRMYDYGWGVPQDFVEAAAWYRKAAEQGDASAQFQLGRSYGSPARPSATVEEVAWYRKAAEQGHASAQDRIGGMYRRGAGVPQDDVEAVAWFRKAVEQGNVSAQVALGEMYADGRGVPQDDVEAYKWLHRALTTAHEGARRNGDGSFAADVEEARDPVAGRLTPEQRAEGEKRAREWFPAHPRD